MRVRAKTDRKINYWLTPGKEYVVIGISGKYYRVVNDGGEPTVFSRREFDVVDRTIPSDWVWERFEGEDFANPPGLHEPGFYEDFFDHKAYAVERVQEYLRANGILLPENPKRPY
jgi:hypothetical protein